METIKKQLNDEILLNLLAGIEKPTFVHLVTETEPKMNKRNNPFYGRVKKLTKRNYFIASEFEERVTGNDKKEGGNADFKAQSMKGLKHLSKVVLQSLKEAQKLYARVEFFDEIKAEYTYSVDGIETDRRLIDAYIVKSTNKYSNQPQERKVKVLNFEFKNIKQISIDGEIYTR
jgi:hypothetical protein